MIPKDKHSGEFGSTSIPKAELRRISLFPGISVATIGILEDIASSMLIGSPSLSEGEI